MVVLPLKQISKSDKSDSEEYQRAQETITDRATEWLRRHPYEPKRGKIQKLARFLGVDYLKHRDYLYQISSKAKTEISYGVAPNSPSSQHDWIAVGNVSGALDRRCFPEIENSAINLGWKRSKNRNKELFLKDKLGTARWWTTGKVLLQIKVPHTLARAKQLASNAFIANKLIVDIGKAVKFLDTIHWYSSHDVYRTPNGQTLPYMKIDAYKELLGIEVVLGDSSHRNAVEIKVCPGMLHNIISLSENIRETLELLLDKK